MFDELELKIMISPQSYFRNAVAKGTFPHKVLGF